MASETSRTQVQTQMITVGKQRLRVAIRKGDSTRTPLLLMNGVGVNLEVLQPFVDALNPAIEVIRFDVPGTGDSPAPLIPYRFSAHARFVTEMLDQLGYQQVDVLGRGTCPAVCFSIPQALSTVNPGQHGNGGSYGSRSSLRPGQDSHTTTLSGPGPYGTDRRRNLWGKGA